MSVKGLLATSVICARTIMAIKSPVNELFVPQLSQANKKQNDVPHNWPCVNPPVNITGLALIHQ